MTIHIQTEGKKLTFWFPTCVVFSKGLIKFGLRMAQKHSDTQIPDIPPEAIDALCGEMKRIKKKYGRYELVEVESSDGDRVQIIL